MAAAMTSPPRCSPTWAVATFLGQWTAVAVALQRTGADGYATSSSAERKPVRAAVAVAVASFRTLATSGSGRAGAATGGDAP